MPTITITAEQAAALARGENITIEPSAEELHNVVLFVKDSRSSYYVWDGEIRGHLVYATRYQHLTTFHGCPANEDVRVAPIPHRVGNRSAYQIVQVGV